MKQLIVSLVILGLYMLADVALTACGLGLGLYEANPTVPVDYLLLHYIAISAIMGLSSIGAYLAETRLGLEHITRTAILLITFSYVYVLINNAIMIWRVTHA